MDVILASRSPRRKEILGRIFPDFRVIPSGVDESALDQSDPVFFVREAAVLKARDVGARFPDSLVIAADTVVCQDREIFGKPETREDAAAMLGRLSGRRHRVLTESPSSGRPTTVSSSVTRRRMSRLRPWPRRRSRPISTGTPTPTRPAATPSRTSGTRSSSASRAITTTWSDFP